MATKIGYVGRDASEQINWAEVGANFSGILKEEARVREEKKAEIDRSTREMMRTLDDAVTGDSKNMNTWSLNYAQEAQQQLLMSNALLKNGQLKPKDYTIIRQNLADGTDQAMTLAQDYQSEFAIKKARAQANPGTAVGADGQPITGSQYLEPFLMESAEGFGNFSKSKLVIDSKTGRVLVGFVNPETGEIEKDPNKLVGINNLRNRIKGKFDAYDMASSVTKAKAEVFGKFEIIDRKIGSARAQGLLTTYSDPTLRTQSSIDKMVKDKILTQAEAVLYSTFEKTEEYWTESQLSNVYNISSLLTNNLGGFAPNGKKYNFTWNSNDEDENTILLDQVDGAAVPNFDSEIGKSHRENAKEGLRTVLRGAMDHEAESRSIDDYTAPQQQRGMNEWEYKASQEQKALEDIQLDWNGLYSMSTRDRQARLNALANSERAYFLGINNIRMTPKGKNHPEGVRFVYSSGKFVDIPMDLKNPTKKQWADAGGVLSGLANVEEKYGVGGFGEEWYESEYTVGGSVKDTKSQGTKSGSGASAEGDNLFK
jgi:hypothetical protein